jgi:pectate lyase
MTIFYLVTIFVVLLTSAEETDKATTSAWHQPDQGVATSREGWLAGQRSGGLGHDVQVVDIRGVQSHLSAKPIEPTEQAIGAPLWGGQSHPQDPEAGTILFLSFHMFLY